MDLHFLLRAVKVHPHLMPSAFCTLFPAPKSPWMFGTFKVVAVISSPLDWPLTYPDSLIQIPKYYFAASDKLHSFPFPFQIMMNMLHLEIFSQIDPCDSTSAVSLALSSVTLGNSRQEKMISNDWKLVVVCHRTNKQTLLPSLSG